MVLCTHFPTLVVVGNESRDQQQVRTTTWWKITRKPKGKKISQEAFEDDVGKLGSVQSQLFGHAGGSQVKATQTGVWKNGFCEQSLW